MGAMKHDRNQPARDMTYREALEKDASGIAALHADSWRRHYRGAYLDSYLDGDVLSDRLAVWTSRLAPPPGSHYTLWVLDQNQAAQSLYDPRGGFGWRVNSVGHFRTAGKIELIADRERIGLLDVVIEEPRVP